MIDQLKPLLKKLTVFAKMNLKFERPPRLFLKRDSENATSFLGKTAHYDPQNSAITLFISGRHPKDILRSFTHELVHHCQNERGDLAPEKMKSMTNGYAQECPHMRKMEQEAYLQGNMCFRDWEDGLDDKLQYKMQIAEQKFLKENKNMSVKISKKELKGLIQKLLKETPESAAGTAKPAAGAAAVEKKKAVVKKKAADAKKKKKERKLTDAEFEAFMAELEVEMDKLEGDLKAMSDAPTKLEEDQVEEGTCGGKKEDSKTSKKKKCPGAKCPGCPECKPGMKEDLEENEELEEAGKPMCDDPNNPGEKIPCYSIDGEGSNDLKGKEKEPKNESKIQTPEQENSLYESRFTQRNTRLFEKLLKEWTK